ncbi:10883_t:CDS:2, partial [Gigaspora rosea]
CLKVPLLELPFLKMESEDIAEFLEEQILNVEANNQNSSELVDTLTIGQTFGSWDELDHVEANNQNLRELVDAPTIGQTFGSWDELDHFISFFAKSQNFVSVIRGSEYKDGVCRSCRYACEHQGYSTKKNKTSIVEIKDETNKFASKYRAFSEDMLKEIKFWTEIGNLNMRTQYRMLTKQYPDAFFLPKDLTNAIQTFKRQNHVEYEAAILLNYLLERKSDDNR